MAHRTIVAGSRNITDQSLVWPILDQHDLWIKEVVCGKALGVDTLGEQWANCQGRPVVPFRANWKDIDVPGAVIRYNKYGPYNAIAGHMRNEEMARYADLLILIWDGNSSGSKDMFDRAKVHGLKIISVIVEEGELVSISYIN